MVFALDSEPWAAEPMESRLAFVAQVDATNPNQQKARYISDHMVKINPRIDTGRRPRCIAPRQKNIARRVPYWKRRYPGVEVLLCKRDVKGAFKLMLVAISGISHMGCRFANCIVAYLSLFLGWKAPPDNWGVVATAMLQFVSSFRPGDDHLCGPEAFNPFQYVDDGAFAEPYMARRPWLAVSL